MPMRSQAQRRRLWANDPEMARRWEEHTPKGKKLPERVQKKSALEELACRGDWGAQILWLLAKRAAQAGRNEGYGAAVGSVMRANAGLLSVNNLMKPPGNAPQAGANPFQAVMQQKPAPGAPAGAPVPAPAAVPASGTTAPQRVV